MPYTLNNVNIPDGMYQRAQTVRKRGGKVFLVVPALNYEDEAEARTRAALVDKTYCGNCDGCGKVGLEIFTGGPFNNAQDKRHVTYYEGACYVHDVVLFDCPDCVGSGLFTRQVPREKELQL
jgi:hypothetical protein